MPLESVTYISDLNASNPPSSDQVVDCDDHLRNIKKALRQTFPNITGALAESHTIINGVPSRVSYLETQALRRDGGQVPTGDLDLAVHRIINIANPINDNDAVTKASFEALLPQARTDADWWWCHEAFPWAIAMLHMSGDTTISTLITNLGRTPYTRPMVVSPVGYATLSSTWSTG